MIKVLYITDGIYPETIGGMQKVSSQHILMLSDKFDLYVLYSGAKVKNPLFNVTYIYVKWPSVSRFFLNFRYVKQIQCFSENVSSYVDKIMPDVVYSEGPLVLPILSRDIPVIFHPHGLEPFQNKHSILNYLRIYPLKKLIGKHCILSNSVICQGGQLKDILIDNIGVTPSNVNYIGNSFSIPYSFEECRKRNISKKYDLIFVGRSEPRKGLGFFIESVSKISQTLSICIVGNHEVIESNKLHHNVYYAGEVFDYKELYELYSDSKFLILPSLSEGMPTVIMESMGLGVPVIASNVGAVSEVVEDSITGFLFESGDQTMIVNKVNKAVNLPIEEYDRLSYSSYCHIKNKFSFEKIRNELSKIILDNSDV